MTKLCLANESYRRHSTDEGEQLQAGLAGAGWALAGHGYDDGCKSVPRLIDRHQPDIVFVQDVRDWHCDNYGGNFGNRSLHFDHAECLRERGDIFKLTVVKDAGSMIGYQERFAREIGADAIVIYYHEQSVLNQSAWLAEYDLIRTHHSVDRELCESIDLGGPRKLGLVSGAMNRGVYPLRWMARTNAFALGLDVAQHPGYWAGGCYTPGYLGLLAGYRVHVACASRYSFALRKIIESIAMGCIPVTDLPAYDVLPEIDAAIVRVPVGCSLADLSDAIDMADRLWSMDRILYFAQVAREWYDFRAVGRRLDEAICKAATCPA